MEAGGLAIPVSVISQNIQPPTCRVATSEIPPGDGFLQPDSALACLDSISEGGFVVTSKSSMKFRQCDQQ
jgi:hypothetical protein